MILISGAYIPDPVKTVISGANFILNSFESISFLQSKNYDFMLSKLKFDIHNSNLATCELKSISSVYNVFSFMIFIFYIMIIHVLIFSIRKMILNYQPTNKWGKLLDFVRIIIQRCYNILSFSLYIRLILEINEYFLITSLNEISNFDSSHGELIFSFIFSILVIILSFLLILFTIYLAFSSYQIDKESHNKIGEFINGLKNTKICKMYSSILLIRRFIFVLLCIALQSVQSRIPIGILLAFQVLYLAFIVFSKSYKEMIANIIEIFNELFFIVLFGSLLIFNAESDWSEVVIYIYMQLILLNTVICFILFLSKKSLTIYSIFYKRNMD